ncbi:MAG: polyprenyl synthetase family protein [Candidatus Omnitrophica bacterium]|nr:polyprenyl synthetase family protein [Candidatus Omnitrophota bacterium]
MIKIIKNRLDSEISKLYEQVNTVYGLNKISPLLSKSIKEFILRKGKRLRPILFILGYKGFSKKTPPGLYSSSLAVELLHDFMLIHDDIIDKSSLRRAKPSMHAKLDNYLNRYKKPKFNGSDLSLILGDVLYAIAIDSFLKINEDRARKEKALKRLTESAILTGTGEFLELLAILQPISKINENEILQIYDYKTADYSFSTPLTCGAILAGAKSSEIKKLSDFGIFLGRAFQIKDDILSLFEKEKKMGKPSLSDIQEAKRTLLIIKAYQYSVKRDKQIINDIFAKDKTDENDLRQIRRIIKGSGSLDYSQRKVAGLLEKSQELLSDLNINNKCKEALFGYSKEILEA